MAFVVKNCPALCSYGVMTPSNRNKTACLEGLKLCKTKTDCPIKRVIEKARNIGEIQQLKSVANEILSVFEIEGIEG